MKTVILPLLLATGMTFADLFPTLPVALSPTQAVKSVTQLSTVVIEDDGTVARKDICTVFAVKNKGKVVWVTAKHCVEGQEFAGMKIDGHSADIVTVGEGEIDIAILTSDRLTPGLRVARTNPPILGDVFLIGHPFGWVKPIYRKGFFSQDYDYSIVQVPAAPGDSGSPLFNDRNEVIGVMSAIPCGGLWSGFCPMSMATKVSELRAVLNTL
jgi:S1-C subfamily serine protease